MRARAFRRPPPWGTKACQITPYDHQISFQVLKSLAKFLNPPHIPSHRPRAFRRADPKTPVPATLGLQVRFLRFVADFLQIKNSSKICLLQKPHRKQSQSVLGSSWVALGRLFIILAQMLVPFWAPFLINVHTFCKR